MATDWKKVERFVTTYVFQVFGAILALAGMTYLIIYAIQNGYITPELRVAALACTSVGLLVLGDFLYQRHELWAAGVTACGIIGLSSSLMLAKGPYQIVRDVDPYGAGFIAVALIGLAFALRSVVRAGHDDAASSINARQRSEAIASLTLLATFMVPFKLGFIPLEPLSVGGAVYAIALVPLILQALFMGFGLWQRWKILTTMAIAQFVMWSNFLHQLSGHDMLALAGIFLVMPTMFELAQKRFSDFMVPVMIFIATFVWAPSKIIEHYQYQLSDVYRTGMDCALWAVALAAVYLIDSRARYAMGAYAFAAWFNSLFCIIITLHALIVAGPLVRNCWLFAAFVSYGVILYGVGAVGKNRWVRAAGIITGIGGGLHFANFTYNHVDAFSESLTFVIFGISAIFFIATGALSRAYPDYENNDLYRGIEAFIFEGAGSLYALIWIARSFGSDGQSLAVSVLFGALLFAYGLWARFMPLRLFAYCILAIAAMNELSQFRAVGFYDSALVYHIIITAIGFCCVSLAHLKRDRLTDDEQQIVPIGMKMATLTFLLVTIVKYFFGFMVPCILACYGILAIMCGAYRRQQDLVIFGHAWFIASGLSYWVLSSSYPNNLGDYFVLSSVVLATLFFVSGFVLRYLNKFSNYFAPKFSPAYLECLAFILSLVVIAHYYTDILIVALFYVVAATLALSYGIWVRSFAVRVVAYGVLCAEPLFAFMYSGAMVWYVVIAAIGQACAYLVYAYQNRLTYKEEKEYVSLAIEIYYLTFAVLVFVAEVHGFAVYGLLSLFGLIGVVLGLYQQRAAIIAWACVNSVIVAGIYLLAYFVGLQALNIELITMTSHWLLAVLCMACGLVALQNWPARWYAFGSGSVVHYVAIAWSLCLACVLGCGLLLCPLLGYPYATIMLALIAIVALLAGVRMRRVYLKIMAFACLVIVAADLWLHVMAIENLLFRFMALGAIGGLLIVASLAYQQLMLWEKNNE